MGWSSKARRRALAALGTFGLCTGVLTTVSENPADAQRAPVTNPLAITITNGGIPVGSKVTLDYGQHVSQCGNGVDDDGDSLSDLADPDCFGTADDSELVANNQLNAAGVFNTSLPANGDYSLPCTSATCTPPWSLPSRYVNVPGVGVVKVTPMPTNFAILGFGTGVTGSGSIHPNPRYVRLSSAMLLKIETVSGTDVGTTCQVGVAGTGFSFGGTNDGGISAPAVSPGSQNGTTPANAVRYNNTLGTATIVNTAAYTIPVSNGCANGAGSSIDSALGLPYTVAALSNAVSIITPPIAPTINPVLNVTPATTVNTGVVVTFNGTASTMIASPASKYEFDVDGDAAHAFEVSNTTGTTSRTYTTPGPVVAQLRVTDKANGTSNPSATNTTSVPLTIVGPVTAAQVLTSTFIDTPVTTTLLGTDPAGQAITYTVPTPPDPLQGTVGIAGDQLTFTPASGFLGHVSFGYTATNAFGSAGSNTVELDVSEHAPPSLDDLSLDTDEDTPITTTLLGTDPVGSDITYSIPPGAGPNHGTATIIGDQLTYQPAADYFGPDGFNVVATNAFGLNDSAVVTVTVAPVNDPPGAADQSRTLNEDTTAIFDVTATDVDDSTLTITTVGGPSHGTATHTGKTYTYLPAADYNGSDSFTYEVKDPHGLTAQGTVTLSITPVNDAPRPPDLTAVTNKNTAVGITLSAVEVENDPVTFATTTAPNQGTLTGTVPNLTYTPRNGFVGTDTFTYTATDNQGAVGTGRVDITVNQTPANPTALGASPAIVAISATQIGLGDVSALLRRSDTNQALPGKVIKFTAGAYAICSATTGADGIARCGGSVSTNALPALANGYTATFAGDPDNQPATATGKIILGSAPSPAGPAAPTPPNPPATVVRNDSTPLTVNPGGTLYTRPAPTILNPNPPFTASTSDTTCYDSYPENSGPNVSPRSRIEVRDPNGTVILDQTSPGRIQYLIPSLQLLPFGIARGGPFSTTVGLAGRPAGIYTVGIFRTDVEKTGSGACTKRPTVSSFSYFEYRPWQHQFHDVFANGDLRMNVSPTSELQLRLGANDSSVVTATNTQYFSLLSGTSLLLPANVAACATTPASCLPSTATPTCLPYGGCTPSIAIVNYQDANVKIQGIFDLQLHAFVASVRLGSTWATLLSLGDVGDARAHDALAALAAAAAAQHIDLLSILSTTVEVRTNNNNGTSTTSTIGVFQLLQVTQGPKQPPTAVYVHAPITIEAGVIIHFSVYTVPCAQGSGYVQQFSQIVPNIPALPAPLSLFAPGTPLMHIRGSYPANTGTHVAALAADTQPGEPNGLPFWVPLASGVGTFTDSAIDFVGTGTFTPTVVPLGDSCIYINILLGTGLAIFGNNPLPVGLGDIPLLWDDMPEPVDTLIGAINEQTASLLNNPQVQELIATVTGQLPAIPLPALPGG